MFPWQSLPIRVNFPKVMQASGMVCLLQGWQLPSAGVAEAPAATSCYSPQIHWVSVRGKSGEFLPNIHPPPILSTLQQIKLWPLSSVSNVQFYFVSEQNHLVAFISQLMNWNWTQFFSNLCFAFWTTLVSVTGMVTIVGHSAAQDCPQIAHQKEGGE